MIRIGRLSMRTRQAPLKAVPGDLSGSQREIKREAATVRELRLERALRLSRAALIRESDITDSTLRVIDAALRP